MYKKKIITSEDGSTSIALLDQNEQYHSIHGAIQESEHIFIKHGLQRISLERNTIHILEIGMGTGLNVLLSFLFAQEQELQIHYTALEKYPLEEEWTSAMNYAEKLHHSPNAKQIYEAIHSCKWNTEISLSDRFKFIKINKGAQDINYQDLSFDLVYHDAFNPDLEPSLWSEELFNKFYAAMKTPSILTTYSTKGIVKRALKSAGFIIEKKPGPIGKREILNALKK
ncbi:MAG: SAM-dependent methyltransferase [Bacteroidetes bacterium 4572_77]|nr:MAG: SAM-dependent methyltransferase [Bacteroidetes bacterium 4572_77]